jgi:histidine triad (HIT) family protein
VELTPEQKAAIEEQKQYCPFCKIVKGEIPVSKVFENSTFIAILDINPAAPGHTLLIPKEHYPVMPFLPDKERDALATVLPQLGSAMQRATLTRGGEYFIANGAAAGQQTSHFLIHLFPRDGPKFVIAHAEHERGKTLRAALSARYASTKDQLGAVLSSNEQIRQLIVEKPREFIAQLPSAPDLATLFQGVDVMQLADQLSDSQTPRAAHMEDEAFLRFLTRKEKLRELLLGEQDVLAHAIESQPKLKAFFDGVSVGVIAERYKKLVAGGSNV